MRGPPGRPPRLFLSCRLSALSRFTWRLCERGALCWVARPRQGSLPPRAQSPGDRDQETWLQGRSLTLGPQPCPRLLCERPWCREACAVSAVPLRVPSTSPTGEESKAISKPVGGGSAPPESSGGRRRRAGHTHCPPATPERSLLGRDRHRGVCEQAVGRHSPGPREAETPPGGAGQGGFPEAEEGFRGPRRPVVFYPARGARVAVSQGCC